MLAGGVSEVPSPTPSTARGAGLASPAVFSTWPIRLSALMHLPAPILLAGPCSPKAMPGQPILHGLVSPEERHLPLGFCLTVTVYTPILSSSPCLHTGQRLHSNRHLGACRAEVHFLG